jgi:hypothetical protein
MPPLSAAGRRALLGDQHEMIADQVCDGAPLDELVLHELIRPHRVRGEEDVARRPVLDLLGEAGAGSINENHLAAALAIALGNLVERRLQSEGGQHAHRLCRHRRRGNQEEEQSPKPTTPCHREEPSGRRGNPMRRNLLRHEIASSLRSSQ